MGGAHLLLPHTSSRFYWMLDFMIYSIVECLDFAAFKMKFVLAGS